MNVCLGQVLAAVGLDKVDLQAAPASLSDGYKRRLALAVQLVRAALDSSFDACRVSADIKCDIHTSELHWTAWCSVKSASAA